MAIITTEVSDIKKYTDDYIKVATSIDVKTVCKAALGLFLGVIPGIIYIWHITSKSNKAMEALRAKITNTPLLNAEAKKAYTEAIKSLRSNGLDVSSFLPKERHFKQVEAAFCHALLNFVPDKKMLSIIESNNSLSKLMNILKKSTNDMPESYYNILGSLKRIERTLVIQDDRIDFLAGNINELLTSFVKYGKFVEDEASQCFNLIEQFLNIPDPKEFTFSFEFLFSFVDLFYSDKDQMINDINNAILQNDQTKSIRNALWKKWNSQHKKLEEAARLIENNEPEIEAALGGKQTYGKWIVNNAKWVATPVTAPVGWLWGKGASLVSHLVPNMSPVIAPQQAGPLNLSKGKSYEGHAATQMITTTITSIFNSSSLQSSDYEIGHLISDHLIPPNVEKFTRQYTEDDSGNIQKTNFIIELSKEQSASLGDEGRNTLSSSKILNQALKLFKIKTVQKIQGSIDHINNKITFEPGHITGNFSGMERTLLAVTYLPTETHQKLKVEIAPPSDPSAIKTQYWTKKEFEGTFGDLKWPESAKRGG